ncbi:MAG TPA: response regulator transcription factor [Candidatus Methylomirabilis sp.]|nr:response regulator transcription factor [Candidatus Methylomirabilis sp.]
MGSSNRRIRVVVADDSRTALRAVCKHLELDGRFEIVGIATDGVRLLHQTQRHMPDLVLADLSMPRMNGLQAANELRKAFPALRVLIFSGLQGASIRDECLKHGADGFLSKSQMPENLMQEVSNLFPNPAD